MLSFKTDEYGKRKIVKFVSDKTKESTLINPDIRYERKESRIDEDLYQALIPPISEVRKGISPNDSYSMLQAQLANADLRSSQCSIHDGNQWSTTELKDESVASEFMTWFKSYMDEICKKKKSSSSFLSSSFMETGGENSEMIHVEYEEQSLHFLAKSGYNLEMAKFFTRASLNAGRSVYLEQLDTMHYYVDKLDRKRENLNVTTAQSWQNWLAKARAALVPRPEPTLKTLKSIHDEALGLRNFEYISSLSDYEKNECKSAFSDIDTRKESAERWVLKIFNLFAVAVGRSSLKDVEHCLSLATSIKVNIPENNLVKKIIKNSKDLREKAKAVIESTAQHTSLLGLRVLYQQALNLPLIIPEEEIMFNKIQQVSELQKKVVAILNRRKNPSLSTPKMSRLTFEKLVKEVEDIDISFDEVSNLRQLLSDIETWVHNATSVLKGKNHVEAFSVLVEESNTIPVDLSDIVLQLEDAVNQSKNWLNKASQTVLGQSYSENRLNDWINHIRKLLNDPINAAKAHETLVDLIQEADILPVIIEEEAILNAEIQSRVWSKNVSDALNSNILLTPIELKDMLKSASNILDTLQQSLKNPLEWNIEKEGEVSELLNCVDSWIERVNNVMVEEATLEDMKQLISESRNINADLNEFVTLLETRVKDCESWLEKSASLFQSMNILTDEEISVIKSPNACAGGVLPNFDEQTDVFTLDNTYRNYSNSNDSMGGNKLSINEIYVALSEVEKLNLSHKAITAIKQLIYSFEAWKQRYDGVYVKSTKKSNRVEKKIDHDELNELLMQAMTFPISLNDEISAINQTLQASNTWVLKAGEVFNECSVTSNESELLEKYINYLKENVENDENLPSGEVLENICFEGSMEDIIKSVDYVCLLARAANYAGTLIKEKIEPFLDQIKDINVSSSTEVLLRLRLQACTWATESLTFWEDTSNEMKKDLYSRELSMIDDWKEIIFQANKIIIKKFPKETNNNNEKEEEEEEENVNVRAKSMRKSNSKFKKGSKKAISDAHEMIFENEEFMRGHLPSIEKANELAGGIMITLKATCEAVKIAHNIQLEAKALLNKKGVESEEFLKLYEKILNNSICSMPQLVSMRNELDNIKEWESKVNATLDGSSKMSIIEIEKAIREAEAFTTVPTQIPELHVELEKGKEWEVKFKSSGFESGGADVEELKRLLEESSYINVDLNPYVTNLKQAIQVYCLCRRAYSGFMIGCDTCEEWYHGACIDMGQKKVKKQKSFSCIKCIVKKFISSNIEEAAGAVSTILVAHKAHAHSSHREKVVFLEQFFSTEKGQLVLTWLNNATHAIQIEKDNLKSNLIHMKPNCMPNETLKSLVDKATTDSLTTLPVIAVVCKAVRSMEWSMSLLSTWAVCRPTIDQWRLFTEEMHAVPIEGEVANFVGNMLERAIKVKHKAQLGLDAKSGFKSSQLAVLLDELVHTPCNFVEEEKRLECVISDNAQIYCGCEGYNDGRFMLVCDDCDGWYHGSCVWVTDENQVGSEKYMCPPCAKAAGVPYKFQPPPEEGAEVPLFSFSNDVMPDTSVINSNKRKISEMLSQYDSEIVNQEIKMQEERELVAEEAIIAPPAKRQRKVNQFLE